MIHIDFQGGAHGNYLEFVCNRIAGVVEPGTLPFNWLGASHNKPYHLLQVFFAWHYSYTPDSRYPKLFNKIISIQINPDDLLPLTQISLLRAGDYGYDNDQLEINTFNKLNNEHYRWMLDTLIDGFFANQISQSYDAVRDPSWPMVASQAEFSQLPEYIRTECLQQHGLVLLELNEQYPDCPRSVLREFFKIGFQDPGQQGFIVQQKKVQYSDEDDVYTFPFDCFYHKDRFLEEIKKVAMWAKIQYTCENEIALLHDQFLSKQLYRDSKQKCDCIVESIKNNNQPDLNSVTMLEEAYVNAALGWDYFQ
jgi:hypothetical protein